MQQRPQTDIVGQFRDYGMFLQDIFSKIEADVAIVREKLDATAHKSDEANARNGEFVKVTDDLQKTVDNLGISGTKNADHIRIIKDLLKGLQGENNKLQYEVKNQIGRIDKLEEDRRVHSASRQRASTPTSRTLMESQPESVAERPITPEFIEPVATQEPVEDGFDQEAFFNEPSIDTSSLVKITELEELIHSSAAFAASTLEQETIKKLLLEDRGRSSDLHVAMRQQIIDFQDELTMLKSQIGEKESVRNSQEQSLLDQICAIQSHAVETQAMLEEKVSTIAAQKQAIVQIQVPASRPSSGSSKVRPASGNRVRPDSGKQARIDSEKTVKTESETTVRIESEKPPVRPDSGSALRPESGLRGPTPRTMSIAQHQRALEEEDKKILHLGDMFRFLQEQVDSVKERILLNSQNITSSEPVIIQQIVETQHIDESKFVMLEDYRLQEIMVINLQKTNQVLQDRLDKLEKDFQANREDFNFKLQSFAEDSKFDQQNLSDVVDSVDNRITQTIEANVGIASEIGIIRKRVLHILDGDPLYLAVDSWIDVRDAMYTMDKIIAENHRFSLLRSKRLVKLLMSLGEVLSSYVNTVCECVEKIRFFIDSAQSTDINETIGVTSLDWIADKILELQTVGTELLEQFAMERVVAKPNMTQPELRDFAILFLINACHLAEAIIRENVICEKDLDVTFEDLPIVHAQSTRTGKELLPIAKLLARSVLLTHRAIGPLLSMVTLRRDASRALKAANESASSVDLERYKQQAQKSIQSKAATEELEEGLSRKASVVELQNLRDMLMAQLDASKRADNVPVRRRSVAMPDTHSTQASNADMEDLLKQLCLGVENAHDRLDSELPRMAKKNDVDDMDKAVRTIAGQVKRQGLLSADKLWVDDKLDGKADKGEFQRMLLLMNKILDEKIDGVGSALASHTSVRCLSCNRPVSPGKEARAASAELSGENNDLDPTSEFQHKNTGLFPTIESGVQKNSKMSNLHATYDSLIDRSVASRASGRIRSSAGGGIIGSLSHSESDSLPSFQIIQVESTRGKVGSMRPSV